MRVVLLGPPGVGKGTQASAMKGWLSVPHISTGDMLREAIAEGTAVGLVVKKIVDAGDLVPDDVMADMVRERLGADDASGGFILDGYPRTLGQGETLRSILKEDGKALDHAVCLTVDQKEIIRRLSARRTCAECGALYNLSDAPPRKEGHCDRCGGNLLQRDDDREEVISRRLAVYEKMTEPLIGFYREEGILKEIDAGGTVQEVARRVSEALRAAPA